MLRTFSVLSSLSMPSRATSLPPTRLPSGMILPLSFSRLLPQCRQRRRCCEIVVKDADEFNAVLGDGDFAGYARVVAARRVDVDFAHCVEMRPQRAFCRSILYSNASTKRARSCMVLIRIRKYEDLSEPQWADITNSGRRVCVFRL